jgi:hypothetical protein
MKRYHAFVDHLQGMLDADARGGSGPTREEIVAALDGLAGSELRKLVPLSVRRKKGAFFTGSSLAGLAVEGFTDTLSASSVVADPACGAGDLLLAAATALADAGHDSDLDSRLLGRDLQPAFVAAARLRLLLAESAGFFQANPSASPSTDVRFPGVSVGSGLRWTDGIVQASHILLNPPFNKMAAPRGCSWGSGAVSGAAVFLEAVLRRTASGGRVQAILPEVLRGGALYGRWRREIEKLADVRDVSSHGRFDSHTDVDVFILSAHVVEGRPSSPEDPPRGARWLERTSTGLTVGDLFSLSVGAVVNNRDPHDGPHRPYAVALELPMWSTTTQIARRRRFAGRLHRSPFVLVRRTSSPADSGRARATLVDVDDLVAVDNHLIVLEPMDGGLATCKTLMNVLRTQNTNNWLNSRIRCRHLTIDALSNVPWKVGL